MVVAREYPTFEGTLRIVSHGCCLGVVPCIELLIISAFVSSLARIHPFPASMIEGRQESAPPLTGSRCRLRQIKRSKRLWSR